MDRELFIKLIRVNLLEFEIRDGGAFHSQEKLFSKILRSFDIVSELRSEVVIDLKGQSQETGVTKDSSGTIDWPEPVFNPACDEQFKKAINKKPDWEEAMKLEKILHEQIKNHILRVKQESSDTKRFKKFKGLYILIEDDLLIYVFKNGHYNKRVDPLKRLYCVVEDDPYCTANMYLLTLNDIAQRYCIDRQGLEIELNKIFDEQT